jgi:hypothetical protein
MDGKTAWHLYVADQSEKYSSEQTLEIIMFDLDSVRIVVFLTSTIYSTPFCRRLLAVFSIPIDKSLAWKLFRFQV